MATVQIYRPTGYIGEWLIRELICPTRAAARKLARRRLGRSCDTLYGRAVHPRPYAIIWIGQKAERINQPVEIVQSVGEIGVW